MTDDEKLARRIINANSNYMEGLDRGQCNFSAQEVLQIALAAIAATTERDARITENDFSRITLRANIENILREFRDMHPHSLAEMIMSAIPRHFERNKR